MIGNMGKLDRGVRAFLVAPAIVVALILGAGTIGGIILFVVAGIMVATAVTGYCPNYSVFGISTDPGCTASTVASAMATPNHSSAWVVERATRVTDPGRRRSRDGEVR